MQQSGQWRPSPTMDEKESGIDFSPCWEVARRNFGRSIHFYAPSLKRYATSEYANSPSPHFVPISITGAACQLQCDHCRAKILKTMYHATSPEKLAQLTESLASHGIKGALITGGALADGTVPLKPFLPAIKMMKERWEWCVVLHTGLVDEELAIGLADAGIDRAMLDIPTSQRAIKEVLHLGLSPHDYLETVKRLLLHQVAVIPHLVAGLRWGQLDGELETLQLLAELPINALVLVVLMPLEGTPMAGITPPSPQELGRIFAEARLLFPHTPLLLGCARPWGGHKQETDRLAVLAGFNGIAYPADGTVAFAQGLGLTPRFSELCCSLYPIPKGGGR